MPITTMTSLTTFWCSIANNLRIQSWRIWLIRKFGQGLIYSPKSSKSEGKFPIIMKRKKGNLFKLTSPLSNQWLILMILRKNPTNSKEKDSTYLKIAITSHFMRRKILMKKRKRVNWINLQKYMIQRVLKLSLCAPINMTPLF